MALAELSARPSRVDGSSDQRGCANSISWLPRWPKRSRKALRSRRPADTSQSAPARSALASGLAPTVNSATAVLARSGPRRLASVCSRFAMRNPASTVGLRLSRAKSHSVRLIQWSKRWTSAWDSRPFRSTLASSAVSVSKAGKTCSRRLAASVCCWRANRTARPIERNSVAGKKSQNRQPARDQFRWAFGYSAFCGAAFSAANGCSKGIPFAYMPGSRLKLQYGRPQTRS